MILWQMVTGGKHHALHASKPTQTACGQRVPMTARAVDADLVDSVDRCRDPKCIAARNAHLGR